MKNTFTGKRVRLRAFEPEDLALFEAEDKNRDTEKDRCDYMIQLPRAAWKLREDFPSRLRREGEMETFRFMIEDLEGNTVGSINAHDVDARMGHVQLWPGHLRAVSPQGIRAGGHPAAAPVLLPGAADAQVQHRGLLLQRGIYRLHRSLGFVEEGRLRESVYTKGRYFDDVCFGMTREEFLEKYSEFAQEG